MYMYIVRQCSNSVYKDRVTCVAQTGTWLVAQAYYYPCKNRNQAYLHVHVHVHIYTVCALHVHVCVCVCVCVTAK